MTASRPLLFGVLAVAAMGLGPTAGPAFAGNSIAVVALASSPLANLTEADVRKAYSGGAVAAAPNLRLHDYSSDIAIRDVFYGAVTRRDGTQMHAFWVQYVFSGSGRGPAWAQGSTDMLAAVVAMPNAIGFVWENEVTPNLKVIARIPSP